MPETSTASTPPRPATRYEYIRFLHELHFHIVLGSRGPDSLTLCHRRAWYRFAEGLTNAYGLRGDPPNTCPRCSATADIRQPQLPGTQETTPCPN